MGVGCWSCDSVLLGTTNSVRWLTPFWTTSRPGADACLLLSRRLLGFATGLGRESDNCVVSPNSNSYTSSSSSPLPSLDGGEEEERVPSLSPSSSGDVQLPFVVMATVPLMLSVSACRGLMIWANDAVRKK